MEKHSSISAMVFLSCPRLKAIIFILYSLLLAVESAQAYCVYNDTPQTIGVTTKDGGDTLRNHTLQPFDGAYEDEGDNGDYACANYDEHLNLPQTHLITMWASTSDWICILSMQAGGYAVVYDRSRAALAIGNASAPPDDLYCRSFDHDHASRDDSRPTGYDGNSLGPADRDIRFLVTADPQYIDDKSNPDKDTWNASADAVMASMVNVLQTSDARGILIAGDLTQDADNDELQMYTDATAGLRRFFFDGIGNHHPDEIEELDLETIQRNTVLTSRSGPHYSWDWQDIHFVQLNIFPGNGVNGNHGDKDPLNSLSFLESDLATYVGDSERPVILIHHYGFDCFSQGTCDPYQVWWTAQQRADYLNVIDDYNVIAMFTGHTHTSELSSTWTYNVSGCSTAGSCIDFIAGAARGANSGDGIGLGVFLDVEINYCNEMIVTRKDKNGNYNDEEIVEFDAPGQVNSACNTPPVAVAGGPYSGDEGSAITFDGGGSYDDDNDALEYRWDFDSDGSWDTGWSSTPTASYTWHDDYTGDVTLQVRDSSFQATSDDTTTVTVNNVDPVIASVSGDTIDENGTATVSGTFSDAGSEDSFTVAIDWGEGSPVVYSYPAGSSGFSETHQYLDDNPSNTATDDYTVSVTVTDDDTGSDSDSTTVTVNNVDPVASIDSVVDQLTGLNITYIHDGTSTVPGDIDVILVGTTIDVAGSYTDIGSQDYHYLPKPPGAPDPSIDWDDGTVEDAALASSGVNGSGAYGTTNVVSHTYATDLAPGNYTIALTITDDDTGADTPAAQINIVDAAGALADALEDIQRLIDAGGLSPAAELALYESLYKITGNPGDDDGDGDGNDENGALDHLERDNLNAALVKIAQAIGYLEDAEAADASLNLTASKAQLALTAKSVVQGAIDGAKAVATKDSEFAKIADAEALMADGDADLSAGDYAAALEHYIDAVRTVESIIN